MLMKNYKTIDEYLADQPKGNQVLLKQIRKVVNSILPKTKGGEEAIRYGIPTLRYNGKNVLHYAGYKKHIGFYPTSSGIIKFQKEISKYEWSKGAVQFPIDKKLPIVLIGKMVKFRVKDEMAKKK